MHDHRAPVRSSVFSTWSYETKQSLALEALRERTRKLPGNIYRAKGVVCASDVPRRRAVLQVVGRRVDIYFQDPCSVSSDRYRRDVCSAQHRTTGVGSI